MGSIPSYSVRRNEIPFEISFTGTIQPNTPVDFLVTYKDGDYQDYETFSLIPYQTYIDINYNLVSLSVSSTGKLGFENTSQSTGGRGFIFDDTAMLFEMGLIMGTSTTNLWNSVRSTSTTYDDDFVMINSIKERIPGVLADAEAYGAFSNDKDPKSQKIGVEYKTYAWKDAPNDHFIVLEYEIQNRSNERMDNFYVGLFSDWDISNEGSTDEAGWLMDVKTGYVKPKSATSTLPIGGIQLLSEKPNYYAIDNDHSVAGSAIGLYDGYSDVEKFLSLSNSVIKTQAGSALNGGDVSHVVSSGPYTMEVGEKITIAFAVHGVKTIAELERSARHADTIYNFILKAPMPIIDTVTVCYEGTAKVKPTGGTLFHWYDQPRNGQLLHAGDEMIFEGLRKDTTVYVSSVYDGYESLRAPVLIRAAASPFLSLTGGNFLCSLDPIIIKASFGDSFLWSNDATTSSITVTEPGIYNVLVSSMVDDVFCENLSESITITALEKPVAKMQITPADALKQYSFTDISEGATSWFWKFGDGATSSLQSPTYTYARSENYTVELIVTNDLGCQDNAVAVVSTIVSVALDEHTNQIIVYPIPSDQFLYVEGTSIPNQRIHYTLYNTVGITIFEKSFYTVSDTFNHQLDINELLDGVYVLRIQQGETTYAKRILIKK
jgi:serine protease